MSINNLLNIGQSSLMAHQVATNTVGNNIANVNTIGYSRQIARFEDRQGLNYGYGLIGQGVDIGAIDRQFSRFVEDAYLDEFAPHSRWAQQSLLMSHVESSFNESADNGIAKAMDDFFGGWQDLSKHPSDDIVKDVLLKQTELLASLIRTTKGQLDQTQREMDLYIEQTVDEVNSALGRIAELNHELDMTHRPGEANANQLLDMRDLEVRKLAGMIDIDVKESTTGEFSITTKAGHTLLQGDVTYGLSVQDGRIENHLTEFSDYTGTVEYAGTDTHEYTFEVVKAAEGTENATMRVSLDGGKTWMRNTDGTPYIVPIPAEPGTPIKIKDLEISFTADPADLAAGDSFEVLPKPTLLWHTPTSEPMNITPQTYADGTENTTRVVGGKLAAFFTVRDQNIGRYQDKMDALSETLIWEVNKAYSQGAGLEGMGQLLGSVDIEYPDVPMGDDWSGLHFSDRLTTGNMTFQIYDSNGDPVEVTPSDELDFDPTEPGIQNFDPSKHSYEDLEAAINTTYAGYIKAELIDGKMQMTAVGDNTFSVRTDSTGILATLGVNTFFQGSDASDISLVDNLGDNLAFINSGSLNDHDGVTPGDNVTATMISSLASGKVTFSTGWETSTTGFSSYYGGLVGNVGSDTRTAKYNNNYHTALAKDMSERSSAYSGVSIDEEMTSLVRLQHSYTAAAKLITTADQMLQILLGLKQ